MYTQSLFWAVGACAATRLALHRQSRQNQHALQKSEAAEATVSGAGDGVKGECMMNLSLLCSSSPLSPPPPPWPPWAGRRAMGHIMNISLVCVVCV